MKRDPPYPPLPSLQEKPAFCHTTISEWGMTHFLTMQYMGIQIIHEFLK